MTKDDFIPHFIHLFINPVANLLRYAKPNKQQYVIDSIVVGFNNLFAKKQQLERRSALQKQRNKIRQSRAQWEGQIGNGNKKPRRVYRAQVIGGTRSSAAFLRRFETRFWGQCGPTQALYSHTRRVQASSAWSICWQDPCKDWSEEQS